MIITTDDIKQIYSKDDIKDLEYDIAMMELSLCAGTQDAFITYGNYKKVLKEYKNQERSCL